MECTCIRLQWQLVGGSFPRVKSLINIWLLVGQMSSLRWAIVIGPRGERSLESAVGCTRELIALVHLTVLFDKHHGVGTTYGYSYCDSARVNAD